jgi:integrase
MASLRARHGRSCALGKSWTTFEAAAEGCTCRRGPTYYVAIREGAKLHWERVGQNRRAATRALVQLQAAEDEGSFVAPKNIRFKEWADQWLSSLERKQNTVDSYRSSITYAKEAFGAKVVRKLQSDDVKRFLRLMRERGIADATRAKHLRVLNACLNSAVSHGYAMQNPIVRIPKGERPRPDKKEAAYFENDELPCLFAHVPDGLYKTLFLVALKTGLRQGELVALIWADVDLSEKVIRVRHNYTAGYLSNPKNHEKRSVDLTKDVVDLLAQWWGECGRPNDNRLVFPCEIDGSFVPYWSILDVLYKAMKSAGVRRVGPTAEKRTFHTFRHTYAKIALENGALLFWLSRQLGHSSPTVTSDIYGHWERKAARAEAAKLTGAFTV